MLFFRKRKEKLRREEFLRRLEQQQAINADRIERDICASLARGNISLQFGDYATSQDLDNLQRSLVDYFLKNRKNESA